MNRSKSLDLTSGSVFYKLLVFTFPLLVTNLLQQLYHSADMIVVGRFAQNGADSLAAIGATAQISALCLNFFVGISVGSNVLCAQRRGAGDKAGEERAIGSSLALSFAIGILVSVIGYFASPVLLEAMNTPKEILAEADLYLRILFLGQPAAILFNFCAAIFRAGGNTKLSMRILMVSGAVNVVLNLFFVLVFHLDTAGVAIATAISNYLSAVASLYVIFNPKGEYCFAVGKVRFYKKEAFAILKMGIPTGINSTLFNVSNVIIGAAANVLGKTVVAAVSAANSISNIVNTTANSFSSALISFAGQNYGAGKFRRAEESFWKAILLVESVFLTANLALTAFPSFFLGFYTTDETVIRTAIPKLMLTVWGIMVYMFGKFANSVKRGFGSAVVPTVMDVGCICGARVFWVLAIYPHLPQTIFWLYLSLPISWILTSVVQMIDYAIYMKKTWRRSYEAGKLCSEDAAYFERKMKKGKEYKECN